MTIPGELLVGLKDCVHRPGLENRSAFFRPCWNQINPHLLQSIVSTASHTYLEFYSLNTSIGSQQETMVIVLGLPPVTGNIWYLAYGSNLSSSKFVNDRGIRPLDSRVVRVPGFMLVMNTAGVPYKEPSFASIRPFDLNIGKEDENEREDSGPDTEQQGVPTTLLGTAYLVSPEQYKRILASEGGGIAYHEAEVRIESVTSSECEVQQTQFHQVMAARQVIGKWVARTLVAVIQRHPAPRPSHRYMVCKSSHCLIRQSVSKPHIHKLQHLP